MKQYELEIDITMVLSFEYITLYSAVVNLSVINRKRTENRYQEGMESLSLPFVIGTGYLLGFSKDFQRTPIG